MSTSHPQISMGVEGIMEQSKNQDFEKHIAFDKAIREYITDCLNHKATKGMIMASFEAYIDHVKREAVQ